MRRWVENSVGSDLACIPVFQSVNMLSPSEASRPKWDVYFSVLEACEEANRGNSRALAGRGQRSQRRRIPKLSIQSTSTHPFLSLFIQPTNQLNLATAPIADNIRAHTGTTLTRSHKHVYRRLPKSGLRRGV
jgi:hypothetical protein